MHGNKGCLKPCKKRGNWYTQGWLYSKVQIHKKIFFLWKSLRLDLILTRFRTFFLVFFSSDIFSLGLLFLWSYFLRLYWEPLYYLGKKSQASKTQNFIFSVIFSKDLKKFGLFSKVLFPGFFPLALASLQGGLIDLKRLFYSLFKRL